MSATENKKIVGSFVNHLSGGNIEAALELLADDVTWWLGGSMPTSGTASGKQEIMENMFGKAAPYVDAETMSIEVRNIIGDGQYVGVEWISRFKTIKGLNYENFYNVMFELGEGKIQKIREYMDTQYASKVIFEE